MPYFRIGGPMLIDGGGDGMDYKNTSSNNSLNNNQSATPEDKVVTQPVKRNLPIAISIPGNIITEEATAGEGAMVEELFEDLSLFELMELGRSETVLGQNVSYRPIKNISDIYFTYSPKKILALQGTFGDTESSIPLKFNEYVVDGAAYINKATGDLVIAIENMKDNLLVQVEIITAGEIQDS